MKSLLFICALCSGLVLQAQLPIAAVCNASASAPTGIFTIGQVVITPVAHQSVAQSGLLGVVAPLLMVDAEWLTDAPLLRVYPNPASHRLHIASEQPLAAYQMVLTDQMGRICSIQSTTNGASDHQMDLTGLPAGTYMLVIRDMQQAIVFQSKIVKVI